MPSAIIKIINGDITRVPVDAIVNAANSSLLGGGGVDGAIHKAGGPVILEECKEIIARQGGCNVGQAVITRGGNLPVRFVIHTVGPIWNGGMNQEKEKLASCYKNCLRLAVKNHIKTIAFPGISTGAYLFPKAEAAKIAMATTKEFLSANDSLEEVIFVCFDNTYYQYLNDNI